MAHQFRDKGMLIISTSPPHVLFKNLVSPDLTLQQLTINATGTAIAPFLPVPSTPASAVWLPVYVFLFCVRLPFVIALGLLYFLVLEWVPVGRRLKYGVLWLMAGIPGVWWVDLQVDGVKRGQLNLANNYYPKAGSIIASSFTSPLDPIYLAGIFQPIFTRSYPHHRYVERITLFRAIRLAFSPPALTPQDPSKLVSLKQLTDENPNKIICVFPETTTTNGRGILPLCPSLLSADGKTKIYPVNLRYTPQDVTTPVPGGYVGWIWGLLSKPTHQMRVRIASRVYNSSSQDRPEHEKPAEKASGYEANIFDQPEFRNGASGKHGEGGDGMHVDVGGTVSEEVSEQEQQLLDRVAEDLARLGRVKRVGLGVEDKVAFLKIWGSKKR
ncbi:vacuolar sorting vps66 [Pyrenophora seminiperda CCB06]|uniref:Vacuolar sorting vps66 n=1 Tax=Pyrenophora seminiperda CCB06 TaxID=1302712 RepID=A0A3M7M0K1_9PLEO|nr:vacuolar sorting vps66 [Pyrenophora seminiperda CCB06]